MCLFPLFLHRCKTLPFILCFSALGDTGQAQTPEIYGQRIAVARFVCVSNKHFLDKDCLGRFADLDTDFSIDYHGVPLLRRHALPHAV